MAGINGNGAAPPPQIRWELKWVTPDFARECLAATAGNRRAMPSVISGMARDMVAGRWVTSHEALAFDTDGFFIDGHHRAEAVIKSGVGQWMYIAYGVTPAARKVIDAGKPRTVAHAAQMSGDEWITRQMAATARQMAAGGTVRHSGSWGTRQEVIDFIVRHRLAIEFVEEMFRGHTKGIGAAPVRAVCARAYYHLPTATIQTFVDRLKSGVVSDEAEVAVVHLTRFLMSIDLGGGSMAAETYNKTSRALRAFADREKIGRLFAATTELFPLPEDDR